IDLGQNAEKLFAKMLEKDFIAGFPLNRYYENMDNCLLVAVTEKRTRAEIDNFCKAMEEVL
ncbi:MAG: glycine dehydrogenase, partial [Lentisphaerae bacterium]|nr:glycine dehydrogenase [Lentisphaerota bacterium]